MLCFFIAVYLTFQFEDGGLFRFQVFFLFAFLAWAVMMYATDPALPTGIRIDTAYVANDLHIVLEYRKKIFCKLKKYF